MKTLLLSVFFASACGAASHPAPATAAQPAASQPAHGPQIKLATIYVDDQDKALRFYTEVLGFTKKDDVSNSGYRWLTVADTSGGQLLLAANDNPAAKAYQEALFQQGQPAVMFFTDDVKGDYERMKARGAEFTMPPTEVMAGSVITQVKDTCGNLVQLTQLAR
jgi:predicted enzyme related to lactoylglutathione lyase